MGRNGSGGVLIMSVSATVPEKLRGNKKRDEDSFARWRNYSQKTILRQKNRVKIKSVTKMKKNDTFLAVWHC